MGVPDAHDEAALRLAEPVADDGDYRRPSGGLEEAADDLDGKKEGEAVDAEPVGEAEGGGRDGGGYHSGGEEEAEVEAVGEVAGEVHAEGVRGEEGEVELAEAVGPAGPVERGPSGGGIVAVG